MHDLLQNEAPQQQRQKRPAPPVPELARAYLFSACAIEQPPGFTEVKLPFGCLFVTPDTELTIVREGQDFAVLIGYCVDLDDPALGEETLALRMLAAARHRGLGAAAIESENLFGRFAVIIAAGGDLGAFNDATAMRTIYFSETEPVAASHSTLIATSLGKTSDLSLFRAFRYGLPGNRSVTEGVRVVPGNFLLDLRSGEVKRFWPRDARIERTEEAVYPELSEALQAAAQAVARRWKPAISLTAGIDSRVTLASFRRHPNTSTFTYLRDSEDERDAAFAPEIAGRVQLPHRVLRMADPGEQNELMERVEAMPDHVHDPRLATIYARHFPERGTIHCRSNLLEIGRSFWRKHPVMPERLDAENWQLVSTRKAGSIPDLTEDQVNRASKLMTSEMQRFFEMAGYDRSDPRNPQLLGYDAWDLVYWEHRMSTWHAQILLASDFTFDTAIVFNSRRFLSALLSLPVPARMNHDVLLRYISDHAPELRGHPINPRLRRPSLGSIWPAIKRRVTRFMRNRLPARRFSGPGVSGNISMH